MLDAILAFALTLAALATVVTIIMESVQRVFRMRRKNLVQLMKHLNKHLDKHKKLGLTESERWEFVRGVVGNPTLAVSALADSKLGDQTAETALKALGRWDLGSGVYEKVTLEHVLRRLVELESVRKKLRDAQDAVKAELNHLGRKFEEYGSAMSVRFKRNAQFWTMAIGIAFAVLGNVDAVRIFNAYLADDSLKQAVVSQQEELQRTFEEARNRAAQLDQLARAVDEAMASLEADPDNAALRQAYDTAVEALAAQTSPEAIAQSAERAQAPVTDLLALGVPIGWQYFPACPFGSDEQGDWRDSGSQCGAIFDRFEPCITARSAGVSGCDEWYFKAGSVLPVHERIAATILVDKAGAVGWLFIVLGSGVLIGLGAPFWFDVAKRLAQVRRMFGGRPAADQRMSGQEADGSSVARAEIVDHVVSDAVTDLGLGEVQVGAVGADAQGDGSVANDAVSGRRSSDDPD